MRPLPTVTACLPAYNSGPFLEETLPAILGQTYQNLKILISDDASTDNTWDTMERFAAADSRITLIRQPVNLGWTGNCSALVQAVDSDYFFFAFHDDVLGPDYVSRLVEKMEENRKAVLAFADAQLVGENGSKTTMSLKGLDGVQDRLERAMAIARRQRNWPVAIHGLFRSSIVKHIGGPKTHLGGEVAADWPWILRLSLSGEFVRVPEKLYAKIRVPTSESRSWKRNRISFGAVVLACVREVFQSSATWREKFRLYAELVRVWWQRPDSFKWEEEWSRRHHQVIRQIAKSVPSGAILILIDRDELQLNGLVDCSLLPFTEKDGIYWGPPESDEIAIIELRRMQEAGAGYVAICWPAFWWLDIYDQFFQHLRSEHHCIHEGDRIVIFKLL